MNFVTDRTRFLAIMIVALAVTSLTGCAAESEGTGSSGSDGTSEGREGDGADGDGDGDGPECLVGDWSASDRALEDWYRAFVPDDGVVVNSVSGEIIVSFSEADFIYATHGFDVSLTIGGQEALTKFTGGVGGSYRATAGGVMATTVESSDLDGTASVSGIDFSASELGITLDGAGAFVGFECTGDNLILETQSAGAGTASIALEPLR